MKAQALRRPLHSPIRSLVVILLLLAFVIKPCFARDLKASEVLLPDGVGRIESRFDGNPGQPLVFVIGESHVNLDVQKAVADTLVYLRSAYGVATICTEGWNGPLPSPARHSSSVAERAAAKAALLGRHINAVEYIALADPGVHLVGVEDMNAYEEHEQYLEAAPERY